MTPIHHTAEFWKAEREWSEQLARWQALRSRPAPDKPTVIPRGESEQARTPTDRRVRTRRALLSRTTDR